MGIIHFAGIGHKPKYCTNYKSDLLEEEKWEDHQNQQESSSGDHQYTNLHYNLTISFYFSLVRAAVRPTLSSIEPRCYSSVAIHSHGLSHLINVTFFFFINLSATHTCLWSCTCNIPVSHCNHVGCISNVSLANALCGHHLLHWAVTALMDAFNAAARSDKHMAESVMQNMSFCFALCSVLFQALCCCKQAQMGGFLCDSGMV